ncbi:RHS repeat-associated core domain-containing protein, partial [Facilibium subflavum]|uniref:RHS repeat-associated core domain-containing protein n=1 Tax=Facilibium subflavum TaxID=2219058 RepID=UPI0013C2F0C3
GLRNAKTGRSSDNAHRQLSIICQNKQLIKDEDKQLNSQSAYLSKDSRYLANAFNQHAYYFSAAKHDTTDLLLSSSTKLKKVYNFSSYRQQRLFSKNKPLGFSQPLAYNPLTYDGEYQDPETGFVYLRARFYNLQQMRFMQRDRYNLLNRYNAFDDNPVSNTDPSVHSSIGDFFSTDIGAGLASSMVSMMLFGALATFAGD